MVAFARVDLGGIGMESDYRYYCRRAAEEEQRAARAITTEARERHHELATLFAQKAALRIGSGLRQARLTVG
jgi:hypothetical protein